MTRFLVTNDDGLGAPGIALLTQVAARFGDVTVVAPETEQSGISHRITFDRPLKFTEKSLGVYTVDGTPADCVRIALAQLDTNFDWVLSGVNDGANLGVEIFCSGTVAAAREATLLGVPAIAISQYRAKYREPFDWPRQATLVDRVLQHTIQNIKPLHRGWVNLNLPDPAQCPEAGPQLIDCAADFSALPNRYVDIEGGVQLQFKYKQRPRLEGKDVAVCFGGNVAVTRQQLS